MSRKIRLQYPVDSTGRNFAFDGKFHDVSPIDLYSFEINGIEYYVMTYFDHNLGYELTTLLINSGNKFLKIPLVDYNSFFDYLSNHLNVKPVFRRKDINTLPDTIYVSPITNFSETILNSHSVNSNKSKGKNNKFVYTYDLYVPVYFRNAEGYFYSSGCCLEPFNDDITYSFLQAPHIPDVDRNVKSGARLGKSDYSFELEFHDGDTMVVNARTKNNRSVQHISYILPGIHKYNVHYVNTDQNRFLSSTASALDVYGCTFPEYNDLHDTVQAFRDSYTCLLNQQFYAPDKKYPSVFNEDDIFKGYC